jgi:type IV pilus assembly protein PilM
MRRARSPIALDFGDHAVKAVQLELRGGELHVRAAAHTSLANGEDADLAERQLAAAHCVLRQASFRGREVRIALPLPAVTTRHLRLPNAQLEQAGARIAETIASEPGAGQAVRICPLPVADLLDQGEHQREFVCCIAEDRVVDDAIARCERLGLAPVAIELAPLAQCRPLLRGAPQESFALVDFGVRSTRFVLVRAGAPVLLRVVPFGGRRLQATLDQRLQLDADALADLAAEPAEAELLQQAVGDALEPVLAPLLLRLAEGIRYCGSLFHGRTVTRLQLAGGSAPLPGLATSLARAIGLSTHVVDPLPGLDLPSTDNRAAWTTAVGLALGGLP